MIEIYRAEAEAMRARGAFCFVTPRFLADEELVHRRMVHFPAHNFSINAQWVKWVRGRYLLEVWGE